MSSLMKGILVGSLITLLSGQAYSQQQDSNSKLKDASFTEKAIVYGSSAYLLFKDPEAVINANIHEGTHSLAALLMGVKGVEYSPLPLIFSDQLFKEIKYGNNIHAMKQDTTDQTLLAAELNMGFAGLRLVDLEGPIAYAKMENPQAISPLEKITISMTPFGVDVITIAAFHGEFKRSVCHWAESGQQDFACKYVKVQIGRAVFEGGASLFAFGDMYIMADAILPSQKFTEWYYEVARRAIGAVAGVGIVYGECRLLAR